MVAAFYPALCEKSPGSADSQEVHVMPERSSSEKRIEAFIKHGRDGRYPFENYTHQEMQGVAIGHT